MNVRRGDLKITKKRGIEELDEKRTGEQKEGKEKWRENCLNIKRENEKKKKC